MPNIRSLIFAAAALAPAAVSAGAAAPLPTLSVDAAPIGHTVEVRQVAGVPYEVVPMYGLPAHTRADLLKTGKEVGGAVVQVIPLNAMKTYYPADIYPAEQVNYAIAIAQGAPIKQGRELPYFPPPNMIQRVAGAVARISNADVQGFRYLTAYSPDSGVRIPRMAVRYAFLGVTRDGQNLVIMHAPYEVPTLPTSQQIDREDARYGGFLAPFPADPDDAAAQAAWKKANERYMQALTTKLNAEGRVGRLADLDAVVKSIRVNQ